MLAIMVGRNRVEVCEIKKKDYEKMFFEHRRQLYMMMPSNLVRLRSFDSEGHEFQDTEEVSVFAEGASCAYDTLREDDYYQEAVLPCIDLFRDVKMQRIKTLGKLESVRRTITALYPFIGIAVLGLVLAYAFLEGSL